MTWAKIDDQFADHPKFLDLSNAAVGVWAKGLAYCSRYLTDGYLPASAVKRTGATSRVVDELVDHGLWHPTPGGFLVHDYLVYNPNATEVAAVRAKRAASGRLGGLARGRQKVNPDQEVLDVDPEANGKQSAKQVARDLPSPRPDPTRPDDFVVVGDRPQADDDDRISEALDALAHRRAQTRHPADPAAYYATCRRNARAEHGTRADAYLAEHPDATVEQIVEHLDPTATPNLNGAPMAGANWTVHATYADSGGGLVAAPTIICQSEQEAENRAADERARLFSAGKQSIDVAVEPPTHPRTQP